MYKRRDCRANEPIGCGRPPGGRKKSGGMSPAAGAPDGKVGRLCPGKLNIPVTSKHVS